MSRRHYPKQFLPLVSSYTLVQETLLRLEGVDGLQAPIAVCNEDHRFMMAEQLWEVGIKPQAIILEPLGRNTAPAVAMAALTAASPDDVLLVLPADHVISDLPAFHEAIAQAKLLAEQGFLVTFGIVPTEPETGYGYIKRDCVQQGAAFAVSAFVEKPTLAIAMEYLQSGSYYWNSGMFAFKAGSFLDELEKFNPEMLACCRLALKAANLDMDFVRLDKDIFSVCPADSIDYAVMEKTNKAVVIPLDAHWNDVGSWSALWDVSDKDSEGNAISGDVFTVDTKNSLIHAQNKLVTVIGVNNLIVVETDDAVMIAAKDRVQDVKEIVSQLKALGRSEADVHRKAYRPWGHYDLVDIGDRHQTKRIVVNPGGKLSLQKHHHRAEHWVVVKGTALITKGDKQILITENESTYIPLGVVHCLENPGVIPLEIVEVQSGSYLGEDDIVRLVDQYGRV
jgi:mannose-1-phosphate guanylyltransferase/mannose-1-phosphate guanylyltransferase/mannose-6-phosphate isomerase